MNNLDGLKTYAVSLAMALAGLAFLFAAGEMTWDSPAAGIEAATRRVIGWVLIAGGLQGASLRHAISKLGR